MDKRGKECYLSMVRLLLRFAAQKKRVGAETVGGSYPTLGANKSPRRGPIKGRLLWRMLKVGKYPCQTHESADITEGSCFAKMIRFAAETGMIDFTGVSGARLQKCIAGLPAEERLVAEHVLAGADGSPLRPT